MCKVVGGWSTVQNFWKGMSYVEKGGQRRKQKSISWGRSQRALSVMLRSLETPPPSTHKLA